MGRRLKLINDYYTLESAVRAESSHTDKLCDACGNPDCAVRGIAKKLEDNIYQADLEVIRCESLVPIIDFREALGMDAKFNTFRLGEAWANRVAVGRKVALRTSGDHQIFGYARVLGVDYGQFPKMDALHGANNHMAIDAAVNARDFNMAQVLTQSYGSNWFNTDSKISVIHLERINGAT